MFRKMYLPILLFLSTVLFLSTSAYCQTNDLVNRYEDFFDHWDRTTNRDAVNQFIEEFGDEVYLYQLLYEDAIEWGTPHYGSIDFRRRLLVLCTLAIEGSGEGRTSSLSLIRQIYKQPGLIAPNVDLSSAVSLGNIIGTFLEMGGEESVDLLVLGIDPNYWLEDALPEQGIHWEESEVLDLLSAAARSLYYLQGSSEKAKNEIQRIRETTPQTVYEERLMETVRYYDEDYRGVNGNSPDPYFNRPQISSVCCWILY